MGDRGFPLKQEFERTDEFVLNYIPSFSFETLIILEELKIWRH